MDRSHYNTRDLYPRPPFLFSDKFHRLLSSFLSFFLLFFFFFRRRLGNCRRKSVRRRNCLVSYNSTNILRPRWEEKERETERDRWRTKRIKLNGSYTARRNTWKSWSVLIRSRALINLEPSKHDDYSTFQEQSLVGRISFKTRKKVQATDYGRNFLFFETK